jgi:hypothetical protein
MELDRSGWSGDGDFTAALLEALGELAGVEYVCVEDSPASRAEAGYAFLSNEVYVRFAARVEEEPYRWLGLVPRVRRRMAPGSTLSQLERQLAARDEIGPAEYIDESMIQYLKTQRLVAPYQTRGIKVVEMVRVYELRTGDAARRR